MKLVITQVSPFTFYLSLLNLNISLRTLLFTPSVYFFLNTRGYFGIHKKTPSRIEFFCVRQFCDRQQCAKFGIVL